MSCCNIEESSCRSSHFFKLILLLAIGAFVIASLPEIKRYVKLSTM
jgi:hypothetical protein